MSTAARTANAIFDAYRDDLDEAEKIHFWELAFPLRPTNGLPQELAWAVSDSFLRDLRRLRERHAAMKIKHVTLRARIVSLRQQRKELRRNSKRRGPHNARQTNRIIRLVNEYGACEDTFVKVGNLVHLEPGNVKARYYRWKDWKPNRLR